MTKEEAIRIISGDVFGITEQTHKAVAMAVEALKRTEKRTEAHACDYISRQVALSALSADLDKIPMVNNSANDMIRRDERIMCINTIEALSSARPNVPETNVGDMISRQSAIDALKMDISIIPFAKAREYVRAAIDEIYNHLKELPSAQQDIKAAYEQGRIMGHVEMRTELLMKLKEIVGDEVWANI